MLLAFDTTFSCTVVIGYRLIKLSDIFMVTEILNPKSERYIEHCYIKRPLHCRTAIMCDGAERK